MTKYDLFNFMLEQQRRVDYNKNCTDNAIDIMFLEGQKNGYEIMCCKMQRSSNLKEFVKFAYDLKRADSNLLIARGISHSADIVIEWIKKQVPERLYSKFALE